MSDLSHIPTPETDRLIDSHCGVTVTKALGDMVAHSIDLERRLTVARATLESITHDMGASQNIHNLCAHTLTITAPRS